MEVDSGKLFPEDDSDVAEANFRRFLGYIETMMDDAISWKKQAAKSYEKALPASLGMSEVSIDSPFDKEIDKLQAYRGLVTILNETVRLKLTE